MKRALAVSILSSVLLMACESTSFSSLPLAGDAPLPTPPTALRPGGAGALRQLASQRGLLIGAAVDADALQSDPTYARLLGGEFNVIVPENVMKFANIHPQAETYDFMAADALMDYAAANGMLVRGHVLAWYRDVPEWVEAGNFSKEQLKQILHEHISTVVGRYKGRIFAWDVVNEAVDDSGQLRDSIWLRGIGPEYIELAFQWAHEADTNAVLFYNDYKGEGKGPKSDAIYELVKGLRERGVPIGGVGLQMHVSTDEHPSAGEIKSNIRRLARLGLVTHITELDVRVREPADGNSLKEQAKIYGDVFRACLDDDKACQAVLMWGLTDKYSSIPNIYQGFGSALLFDASAKPKPAYEMVKDALLGR